MASDRAANIEQRFVHPDGAVILDESQLAKAVHGKAAGSNSILLSFVIPQAPSVRDPGRKTGDKGRDQVMEPKYLCGTYVANLTYALHSMGFKCVLFCSQMQIDWEFEQRVAGQGVGFRPRHN